MEHVQTKKELLAFLGQLQYNPKISDLLTDEMLREVVNYQYAFTEPPSWFSEARVIEIIHILGKIRFDPTIQTYGGQHSNNNYWAELVEMYKQSSWTERSIKDDMLYRQLVEVIIVDLPEDYEELIEELTEYVGEEDDDANDKEKIDALYEEWMSGQKPRINKKECNDETACPITMLSLEALKHQKRMIQLEGRCYAFFAFSEPHEVRRNPITNLAWEPASMDRIRRIRDFKFTLQNEFRNFTEPTSMGGRRPLRRTARKRATVGTQRRSPPSTVTPNRGGSYRRKTTTKKRRSKLNR